MRVQLGGWLLAALAWWQADTRDLDRARQRTLREDWRGAFVRLVVVVLTVELVIATCTLGRVG